MPVTESELVKKITQKVLEELEKAKQAKKTDFSPAGYTGGGAGDGGGVTQFKYLTDTPTYPSEWGGASYQIPFVDSTEEELIFIDLGIDKGIDVYSYDSIIQGTWIIMAGSNNQSWGFFINNSSNDGDEVQYKIWLTKGTYTITLLTTKKIDYGIMETWLGGSLIDTVDLYSTVAVYNLIHNISGIVVNSPNTYNFNFKVNGQHTSSLGYKISLSGIYIRKTG